MPVEVVARSEPSQESTERDEPLMRGIRSVVDPARRRVRDKHIDEAASPNAIDDEPREHAYDRQPHVGLGGLEGTVVIPGRSLETADEQPVDRDDAAVEIDSVPPNSHLRVIQALGRYIMIPVHRTQRSGDRGRHEIEIVVSQVATPEHEIDAPGARGHRRRDCLIFDIADREDAHAISVSRMSRAHFAVKH